MGNRIIFVMKLRSGSFRGGWAICCSVLLLAAFIAACGTISPRRVVINNPSPTPTPGISPTATPTPTLTPTPMAAQVPSQFLFSADPGVGMIFGFQINRDGGLSPVPGSPFIASDSPRLLAAVGKNLLVAGATTLTAFTVDKDTGAIRKTDAISMPSISALVAEPSSGTVFGSTVSGDLAIRMVNNKLQLTLISSTAFSSADAQRESSTTVKDVTGKFVFVLDRAAGTITVLKAQDGASLASYPAGHGASSIALAVP